jgi:hypothetical protein
MIELSRREQHGTKVCDTEQRAVRELYLGEEWVRELLDP